jgi:hypothetical protein
MGKTKGLYNEEYAVGTMVKILPHDRLLAFQKEWKWHNPLTAAQLKYAGSITQVTEVSFYHGGDELYTLKGIPGVWHEGCLEPA